MFEGYEFVATGYQGRAIRFADRSQGGGAATTGYSFAMTNEEKTEMARRIAAALNLTRYLTTDEMERAKPIRARGGGR